MHGAQCPDLALDTSGRRGGRGELVESFAHNVTKSLVSVVFYTLLIQDDGPGIPPELRPKIFDRFVTSGKIGGTGLGLAIARDIVDGHKGSISIQSKVAGEDGNASSGTTFIIRLPIEPQRKAVVEPA